MSENTKLPTRQLAGFKAATKNPNVSDEAKEHAAQMADEIEHSSETQQQREQQTDDKDETRVNAGLKATLKNPNVSQEAKDNAQRTLEQKGEI